MRRIAVVRLVLTVATCAAATLTVVTAPGQAAAAQTCSIYWTGSVSHDWQVRRNWSLTDGGSASPRIPRNTDVVCMSTSPVSADVVASPIDRAIAAIDFSVTGSVTPSLEIQGGTFQIGASDSTINDLVMDGTLTGTADVTLTGDPALAAAPVVFSGAGTKTVGPGAVFTQDAVLTLGTSVAAGGTDLVIDGAWTGSRTRVRLASVPSGHASQLVTNGPVTLAAGTQVSDLGGGAVRGYWLNTGAVQAPDGATVFTALTNDGSMATGDLFVQRGNAPTGADSGTWDTNGAGVFLIGAPRTLSGGAVTGPGGFEVDGTNLQAAAGVSFSLLTVGSDASVSGSPTVATLDLAGGLLTGPGTMTLTGTNNLCDGTLQAGYTLRNEGALSYRRGCPFALTGSSTLDNAGTLAIVGTGCCSGFTTDGSASLIRNDSGAVMTSQLIGSGAGLDVPVPFHNDGTLRAIAGLLRFPGGVDNLAPDGTLTGGRWVVDGGRIGLLAPVTSNAAAVVVGPTGAFTPKLTKLAVNDGSLSSRNRSLSPAALPTPARWPSKRARCRPTLTTRAPGAPRSLPSER